MARASRPRVVVSDVWMNTVRGHGCRRGGTRNGLTTMNTSGDGMQKRSKYLDNPKENLTPIPESAVPTMHTRTCQADIRLDRLARQASMKREREEKKAVQKNVSLKEYVTKLRKSRDSQPREPCEHHTNSTPWKRVGSIGLGNPNTNVTRRVSDPCPSVATGFLASGFETYHNEVEPFDKTTVAFGAIIDYLTEEDKPTGMAPTITTPGEMSGHAGTTTEETKEVTQCVQSVLGSSERMGQATSSKMCGQERVIMKMEFDDVIREHNCILRAQHVAQHLTMAGAIPPKSTLSVVQDHYEVLGRPEYNLRGRLAALASVNVSPHDPDLVGHAQDDSSVRQGTRDHLTGESSADRLRLKTDWNMSPQCRDENRFTYRARRLPPVNLEDLESRDPATLLSQVDDAVEVIEMKAKASPAVSLKSLSPKELHRIMLDTGANKSFCNSQLGKLLRGRKYARFTVMGSAGPTHAVATGDIVAHLRDDEGEEFMLKFQCSELPNMKMNLLSASWLLREGVTIHLQRHNSFLLIPEHKGSGRRRKVTLEETNGLFYLPMMIEAAENQSSLGDENVAGGAVTRSRSTTTNQETPNTGTTTDTPNNQSSNEQSNVDVISLPDATPTPTPNADILPPSIDLSKNHNATTTHGINDNNTSVEETAQSQSLPDIQPNQNDETTDIVKPLQDKQSFVPDNVKSLPNVESTQSHTGAKPSIKRKHHAPGASLELWHKRTGCAKLKLSLMHRNSSVQGLNIIGKGPGCDRTCNCDACRLARASRSNPKKDRLYDDDATRPFQVVCSDIKGPLIESHGQLRYTISFVDQVTRLAKTYYMRKKSEAPIKLKEYLTYVKSLGWYVGLIRTDRGSEYFGNDNTHTQKGDLKNFVEFEKVAASPEWGCRVEAGPRDGSKGNGIVERYHRTVFEIASSFLLQAHMSPLFWPEAYRYAELMYNRMTTVHTGEFSPYELVYRRRPRFDRIRVFGCDIYEHIGDQVKVPGGTRARKGYFMGIPEDSPAGFLMYDIKDGIIRTVYSATFDESFVRRRCGLGVYDKAREIYSNKSRKNVDIVTSDLLFTYEDDPFTYDILRSHLDTTYIKETNIPDQTFKVVNSAKPKVNMIPSSPANKPRKIVKLNSKPKPKVKTQPQKTETFDGDDVIGRDVAKLFKKEDGSGQRVPFFGEVTAFISPEAPDDEDLWRVEFDDGDGEEWDLADLKEGRKMFDKLRGNVGNVASSGVCGPGPVMKRFKLREDGMYDITDCSPEEITPDDVDELQLRALTHTYRESNSQPDAPSDINIPEDLSTDGPLGSKRTEHEAQRQKWESKSPQIRPFRSFSNKVKDIQESSEADEAFRQYALDHDTLTKFVQKNPKTKYVKGVMTKSWPRYEKYKRATSLREMIEISCANRGKMSLTAAKRLARKDIVNDYDRGFIYFPGNESGRLGHWINSQRMATDHGMIPASSGFTSSDVTACSSILDSGKETVSFGEVLNDQFKVDEALQFLEDKTFMAHFAEKSLTTLMARDGDTGALHPTPKTVPEALNGPDRKLWKQAMDNEIANFKQFEVWEECLDMPIPKGTKLLGTKWVLKIKLNSTGHIEKFKARLCALGYAQRENVHFDPNNIYSPVMSYDSFRTLLAIGTANDWNMRSADIQGAFLQGKIDKPIFIKHPLGKLHPITKKPLACRLNSSVYGLKQSPRLFAKALIEQMEKGGLKGLVYDPCLFTVTKDRQFLFDELGRPEKFKTLVEENPMGMETLMVGTWVDDLTQVGSSDLILDWFIAHLRKRFQINEKSTGELSYMLSARITRDREKKLLYLDQSAAITRVAQKCGLIDTGRSMWGTPMSTTPLERHKEKTTDFDYLSIVGSLLHICGVSRPDCAFSISCLARHSRTTGKVHVDALLRLVEYMYQTRYQAITYRGNVEDVNVPRVYESGVHPLDINKDRPAKIFVDSDFAGTDGRSTAGYVVFLNGGPVIWSSKLMKVAATSSSEAEIIAAVESVKTGIHFRCLMEELGVSDSPSITVFEDNLSCRMSAESLKQHKKARHYQGKLRFLQDSVQSGVIKFHQTKTDDMIADIFTKSLPKAAHDRHMDAMLSTLPAHIISLTESEEVTEPASEISSSTMESITESDTEQRYLEFEGSPYEEDGHMEHSSRQLGYTAVVTSSALESDVIASQNTQQPEGHWSQKCTAS